MVPSTTVLHILFTLSIRAPSLNWSHEFSNLGLLVTSEYTRQINKRYDDALYHELLQKRATEILQKYINMIQEKKTAATDLLFVRMKDVILLFLVQPKPRPSSKRQSKRPNYSTYGDNSFSTPSLENITRAVEVISDSEESDAIVETEHSLVLSEFVQNIDRKNVLSFTDLGNCKSGLGETAVLFRDMPHLSAKVTPETSDNDDNKFRREKLSLLDQIHLFDDFLLYKRLQDSSHCTVWSLLRWCLWCADISSQYQKFLFNSSQTKVHEIFDSYHDTLSLIVLFCLLDPSESLIGKFFDCLGDDYAIYDRTIELLFTGLGITTNDPPSPYFAREKILMTSDPIVDNSQCKEKSAIDDNLTSMGLRLVLLRKLYQKHELDSERCKSFVSLLGGKLQLVGNSNLKVFFKKVFDHVLTENLGLDHPESNGELDNSYSSMIIMLCVSMIEQTAGIRLEKSSHYSTQQLLSIVSDDKIYTDFVRGSIFDDFDKFFQSWDKIVFLQHWLVEVILSKEPKVDSDLLQVTGHKLSVILGEIKKLLFASKDHQCWLNGDDLCPEEEFFTPCLEHQEMFSEISLSGEIMIGTSTVDSDYSTQDINTSILDDDSVEEVTFRWTLEERRQCICMFERWIANGAKWQ